MKVKIAIPWNDGKVFAHFGKASQFKLYEIEDHQVVSSEVLPTDCAGHDEIGLWLIQHEVNAVICGNIGPAAQGILRAAGIMALAGVSGEADAAISQLLEGKLEATETANCAHHAGGCGSHCGGGCGGYGGGCHGCCH